MDDRLGMAVWKAKWEYAYAEHPASSFEYWLKCSRVLLAICSPKEGLIKYPPISMEFMSKTVYFSCQATKMLEFWKQQRYSVQIAWILDIARVKKHIWTSCAWYLWKQFSTSHFWEPPSVKCYHMLYLLALSQTILYSNIPHSNESWKDCTVFVPY